MQRLMILLILGLLSFASSAEPLYWQASKGKLNYLILGSLHVGDDSMYPLPSDVTTFFKHSDGLIVETDIRNTNNIQYPPVTTISADVLNSNQQKELTGIANLLGLNGQQLLQSPPWIAAVAIQMKQFEYLGYQADKGVDMWLLNQAGATQKPVLSLESLQFQIDLFAQLPNDGEELLTSGLDQFDYAEDNNRCLVKSWQNGDADKIIELAEKSEMSAQMEKVLLIDRNRAWATQLSEQSLLPKKEGNYLVVVGALHLVGEHNLIDLMKKQGFKVTQRSHSKPANCDFKL